MTILMGARGWRRRRRRSSAPPCSPRNCQVGAWTSWSSCSHRCGSSGTRLRTRQIVQAAACGGSCPFTFQDSQSCNRNNCQHGGTPHSSGCSCRAGYSGTCCELGESTPAIILLLTFSDHVSRTVTRQILKAYITSEIF